MQLNESSFVVAMFIWTRALIQFCFLFLVLFSFEPNEASGLYSTNQTNGIMQRTSNIPNFHKKIQKCFLKTCFFSMIMKITLQKS